MIKILKRWLISDMGEAHLMTTDEMWVENCFAKELLQANELIEFSSIELAARFVRAELAKGGHVQAVEVDSVDWGKLPIDDEPSVSLDVDWADVGDMILEILEKSRGEWKIGLTEEAKAMGGTLNQVIAAAIAQMISKRVQEAFEEYIDNQ